MPAAPVDRTSGTLTVNKTARAAKAPAGRGRPGAGKPAWDKPAGERSDGKRPFAGKPSGDDRPPRREGGEGRRFGEGQKRPFGRSEETGRPRRDAGAHDKPARPGGFPRAGEDRPPRSREERQSRQRDEGFERRGDSERQWAANADPHAARRARAAAAAAERPAEFPRPQRQESTAEGVRLSKVMSERGLCSRREADLWIERGWVFVNGQQVSELGSRIDPAAEISISREAKQTQAKQVTILLHKPVGYVSGQPEPGCIPAVTLIDGESQVQQSGDPEFKPWMLRGLAPAGRLDSDSSGLLVFTQDGRVAKLLIGEDSDVEKEYLVRVEGSLVRDGLKLLNHGLELDGKALRPARVKQLNEDQLHFILKEGKKRQIRRMCELVGLKVIGLKRVRIGRVRLGDLPPGQWRFLRADERF